MKESALDHRAHSSAVQPQFQKLPSRRRKLRYGVQAPMDVTVLRSGIPDTLPGRSVNLGEGGVSAVMAGELLAGEAVAVEIHLPASRPLTTKATVRHYDRLRYGLEFVSISPEQQVAIRTWAGSANAPVEEGVRPHVSNDEIKGPNTGFRRREPPPSKRKPRSRFWSFVLLLVGLLLAAGWWQWRRGWEALEAGLLRNEGAQSQPRVQIPAEAMQRLVRHRVEPEYPASARRQKLEGVIVLDVVVDRNGSVLDVHAKNGPDILARAAVDAMRWWRFEPYRVEGKPAVVETTVAMEFKL